MVKGMIKLAIPLL